MSTPASPSTPPSQANKLLVGLIIIFITLLAVLAFAARLFGFSFSPTPASPFPPSAPPLAPNPPVTLPNIPSETTSSTSGSNYSDYVQQLIPRLISLEQRRQNEKADLAKSNPEKIQTVSLQVTWQKPVKVSTSTVAVNAETIIVNGPYLRGEITQGPAATIGTKVYTGEILCDGMCPSEHIVQIWLVGTRGQTVAGEGYYYQEPVWVPYMSDLIAGAFGLPTHTGDKTHINYALTYAAIPKQQTLPNGKTVLIDQETDGSALTNQMTAMCWTNDCPGYQKVATTKEGFSIHQKIDSYSDQKVIFTEDGGAHTVISAIPFDAYDEARYRSVITQNVLKWNEGYTTNTATYVRYYPGGCGAPRPDNVMTGKEIKNSELIALGKTASGDTLYGIHDPYGIHPETQKAYDNWFLYDFNGNKPSLEEFLRTYPIPFFIWKNAFGENIRYVLSDGVPVAECGKPVIYLYPEKTTTVHVALPPTIDVTVSEPLYPPQGWTVSAQPDGNLTYKGRTYGSLFWEGTGVDYAVPSEGFLLKDGEVDASLKTILASYGLNERESQEFRDFWVPLMTGSPYYRASFVTTQDWNRAAPLSVTPKPKTVIRIFMDWEKLDTPMTMKEPLIQTPARNGFTLIEWGGLLRK